MLKKFTTTDKLLFVAALLSLIFAEVLYFQGEKSDGTFIGLWVPSILAFGIYLKLLNSKKNDWFYSIFRWVNYIAFWFRFCVSAQRSKKDQVESLIHSTVNYSVSRYIGIYQSTFDTPKSLVSEPFSLWGIHPVFFNTKRA